ncbi:right-handed parallel beta-helix repeat-containing protein [Streptomyces sp. NPDC048723]|uniref:right-handed parallel beta-helix repeat-containing protein n=1 Tax=Streptomyces sp. NPDC048723 TaxID=3365589 RepID=UPI0037137D23
MTKWPVGTAEFPNITETIQRAQSGDVIAILPGVYEEHLELDRSLTLEASQPGTVRICSPTSVIRVATVGGTPLVRGISLCGTGQNHPALRVNMGKIRLEDCQIETTAADGCWISPQAMALHDQDGAVATLQRCTVKAVGGNGIEVDKGGKIVLENCRVAATGRGLLVSSAEVRANNCIFQDCDLGGIYLRSGTHGRLERIFATRCGTEPAIAVHEGSSPQILNSTIEETAGSGIAVIEAGGTYEGCTIRKASIGILSVDNSAPSFRHCTVENVEDIGIYIAAGNRGVFTSIKISGCPQAISVKGGAAPKIQDCTVRNMHGGLFIFGSTGSYSGIDILEGDQPALYVGDGGEPTIRNCTIRNVAANAIIVSDSRGEYIGCTVRSSGAEGISTVAINKSDPAFEGLYIHDPSSDGMTIRASQGNFASLRIIDAGDSGISVDEKSSPRLSECVVIRPGARGIGVYCSNGVYRGVEIADATMEGFFVSEGSGVAIENSRVSGCNTGIVVQSGTATIRNCKVNENVAGVTIESDDAVEISGCTVTENKDADLIGANRASVRLLNHHGSRRARITSEDAEGLGLDDGRRNWDKPSIGERAAPDYASRSALTELEALIGLRQVKEAVRDLVTQMRHRQWENTMATEADQSVSPPELQHLIFEGPPGTGKTTVARLYARIAAEIGAVSKGQLVEVSRDQLVGEVIGATEQRTREAFERAKGGVLFIDEAYSLAPAGAPGQDFGRRAIDTLVKLMDDHRGEVIVIAAGYRSEMERWKSSNPGLPGRFGRTIVFPNYTPAELVQVTEKIAVDYGYNVAPDTKERLTTYFQRQSRGETFANARAARTVFEAMRNRLAARVVADLDAGREPSDARILRPDDLDLNLGGTGLALGTGKEDPEQLAAVLDRLHAMVGLGEVKQTITTLINQIDSRRTAGLPPLPIGHLVFTGPPGTGKTTVARLFGQLLSALGMLGEGQIIEVSRHDLVAGYIGQTEEKTKNAFDRARGGVLFIDEAYALSSRSAGQQDFGKQAIDTLVKLMEDHADEVVVIAAGYTDDMEEFLDTNRGLRERFEHTVHFSSYAPGELIQIAEKMAIEQGYRCTNEALVLLEERYADYPRGGHFGNARHVRKTLKVMTGLKANRTASDSSVSHEERVTLRAEDVPDSLP